ncbi:DNA internalization-related competence protein ComEC/Rec2 [Brassicibacter mesophilus]|uniref:DNA internalization-related competence protein ComEC/Rec2 n=1 Tax=Brassicibacter mesophilus TaxID=745119 RepID=UPI003D252FBE
MKRPFVYMMIPFIIGIIFIYKLDVNIYFLKILLLLLIVIAIVCIFVKKGYNLILLLLFFVVGSLSYINSIDNDLSDFLDEDLTAKCRIISKMNNNKDYNTYIANTLIISIDKHSYFVDENIILRVYEGQALDIGDTVKVNGILKRPDRNTNPGLFNYRLYLQAQDIFCILTTNGHNTDIISKRQLTHGQIVSCKFKDYVVRTLDNFLNTKNSNIMKSIILGDDSFLDDYTEEKFRGLGIAHILAVSGLHIGIIFLVITFFLRLLKVDKKISVIIAILLIWIYGYFINFPSSVLRASVMFSTLILSTLTYRRYDSLNVLAFSALILLMYRPSFVFSMGFQFSYIATASLIVFTNRINGFISNESSENSKAYKILSPLIAVQIGMFPVMSYYFNSYCIFSILSNLLIIPLLSLSLMMSFVLLLISLMNIKIAVIVGFFINALINISDWFTDIIYNIPLLNVVLRSMTLLEILLYYLMLMILLKVIRLDFLNSNIAKLIFAYLATVIFLNISIVLTEDNVIIDFIDVGQGDCSLIRTDGKSILVDSGGTILSDFDVGKNIILPYLRKQGVRKIDAVFISHFHEDHCEGLVSLIGNIKIEGIFIGYNPTNNKLYSTIKNLAKEQDIAMVVVNKNDIIRLNKHKYIKVLSLLDNYEDIMLYNENNLSIVMLLEAFNKKVLFTGDIEKEVEATLANENRNYDVDILKVPHHGSKTSSTQRFITSYAPEYAVIQVGKNNFGHPSQEVLNRYVDNNVKVYRNDIDGMITAKLDQNSIKITPYLQKKQNLHDIIIKYKIKIFFMIFYLSTIYFILKRNANYFLKDINDEVTK